MAKHTLDEPAGDIIEVSVFGRGVGESIVCHVGGGAWIIVDSLLTSAGEPVALSYLEGLGVSPDAVRTLILTHWHDDHIKGAARIVERCAQASVVIPATLCRDEFKQLLRTYGNVVAGTFSNGVEELFAVLDALKPNKARRKFASANKILLESETYRVDSLSPSDEDIERFLVAVHDWSHEDGPDQIIAKPRRNDTSVAAVVKIADEFLLFGGDLEVRDALSGWQAVHEIAWGGRGKATLFKVAHHGSSTAEYGPVWEDLLSTEPTTILTPYSRGHRIPKPEDVTRICARSSAAYSASRFSTRRGSKQNRSVDRTLDEAGIELFRLPADVGHVRLRKKIGDMQWDADLFQSACLLQDIAA